MLQNIAFDFKSSPAFSSLLLRKVESKQIILGDTREEREVSGELWSQRRWRAAVWPTFVRFLLRTSNSCSNRPRTAMSEKQLDRSETRITAAGCQDTLHAPRYTTFNLAPTITRHVMEESMKV